jgi:DNA-binding transcriptional ArsR family regulator
MAEDLLARIVREIRDRKRAAAAAHDEYGRLEDALAALGPEQAQVGRTSGRCSMRRSRPRAQGRRRRAAPGANRDPIVAVVRDRPGVSVGEVAQATGIPRTTVAPTMSRLLAAGAVERVELPDGGAGYRAVRVDAVAEASGGPPAATPE